MQDRTFARSTKPSCNARPDHTSGSFSTELAWTKRSLRSAMPPIATEFTRHDESSRSAPSGLTQCSKEGGPNPSFDHLVSAREQHRWHVDAEQPRRLQVDDELEFGRLLDRKIGGLLAL